MDHPEEIWLITYWTDEASYKTWHRGHTYHASHQGIPKGLKLVPKSTEIRFFEHVSD
jgi:heme-degrading monooxygenase HmoA